MAPLRASSRRRGERSERERERVNRVVGHGEEAGPHRLPAHAPAPPRCMGGGGGEGVRIPQQRLQGALLEGQELRQRLPRRGLRRRPLRGRPPPLHLPEALLRPPPPSPPPS